MRRAMGSIHGLINLLCYAKLEIAPTPASSVNKRVVTTVLWNPQSGYLQQNGSNNTEIIQDL